MIDLDQNINEILTYINNKGTQDNGVCRSWNADVVYESSFEKFTLDDVEILYQYSGDPIIKIPSINLPYYSDFNPKYQTFKCVGNSLEINGNGKNGTYKVVIR